MNDNGDNLLCLLHLLLDDDLVVLSILLLLLLSIFLFHCRSRGDDDGDRGSWRRSGGRGTRRGSSDRPANLITLTKNSIRTYPFRKGCERTHRQRSG